MGDQPLSAPAFKELVWRLRWLALLGLALRLGYAWHANKNHYLPTTVDGYEELAVNLVETGVYGNEPGVPNAGREPSYPLLIAAVYKLFGGRSVAAFLGLQCLLSLAVAFLAGALARRLFGEKAGLLAGAAYLLYPYAIYYSAYYVRENLSAFFFTLFALSSTYWAAPEAAARRWTWVSGVSAAGWVLNSFLALPGVLLAGLGLLIAAPPKERSRRLAALLLPVLAGAAVWTGRNYVRLGAVIPSATNGWELFYQALVVSPDELATPRQAEILNADPVFAKAGPYPMGSVVRDAIMRKGCLDFIAAHPFVYIGRVAHRFFVKFWRLWPYQRAYSHGYGAIVALSLLSDGWIIPLALAGFWLFRGRWRQAPALPAGVLGLDFGYSLAHDLMRFRFPVMGVLAAVAVGAALRLSGRARS